MLLPLTEDPKLSWRYGTRHRAAIGITETSDCACIVVSEETGDVSIAIDGELKKYEDLGKLKTDLSRILGYEAENEEPKTTIFNLDKFLSNNKLSDKNSLFGYPFWLMNSDMLLFIIKAYGTVYRAKRSTKHSKKSQGVSFSLSWRIKAAF